MLDSILKKEKSKFPLSWQQQLDLLKYAYKRALCNNPLPATKFASIVYCVHVNRLESAEENFYSFSALAGDDCIPSQFIQKWASQYFETAQYVYDSPNFKKTAHFYDDLTLYTFVKQALIFESQQEAIMAKLQDKAHSELGYLLKKAQQEDQEISSSDIFKFLFSRDVPLSYKIAFIAGVPLGLLGIYSIFTGNTMQGLLLLGLGGLLSYGTYYTVGNRLASIVEEKPEYLAILRGGGRSTVPERIEQKPGIQSPVQREIVTRGKLGVPQLATGLSRGWLEPIDMNKYIYRPKTPEQMIPQEPPVPTTPPPITVPPTKGIEPKKSETKEESEDTPKTSIPADIQPVIV